MAYTYNDFVTAATGAGMLDLFGEDDLKIAQTSPEYGLSLLKLNQDLKSATTTEQQLLAQEAMNQLRQSYNSLGSSTGQSSFGYDPAQDPSYTALRKTYLRDAERARADTLAEASAAMGGVPSSYAVTAASQAGDYYAAQLTDQIPTLEQNAYQRYLNEQSVQKEAAELMAAKGDYSLLAKYYGLTDEQAALLKGSSGGTGAAVTPAPAGQDYSWLTAIYPSGEIDNVSWSMLTAAGYSAADLKAAGFRLGVDTKTKEEEIKKTTPSNGANYILN